jgi:NAD(P)-dependent dehydrogenase (short-subunit alcohol dehydrogenase family)
MGKLQGKVVVITGGSTGIGLAAAVKGTAAFWVYGATKAAIRNFVRGWTVELQDRRIRANVLSPGPTETPMVSQQPADVMARLVSTVPIGRIGQPEEIAKAALFLASNDSSFVAGIELAAQQTLSRLGLRVDNAIF